MHSRGHSPEEKIRELELRISDLYGKISEIRMQVGLEERSYTGNMTERLEKLEQIVGDPFRLFSWEGKPILDALTKMVGDEGEQHIGPKTQKIITIFRIIVELRGMKGHLSALASRAESKKHLDGLDKDNMKSKDIKMNQLKKVLLDALGIMDINDIQKLVEICWKCHGTPIEEIGFLPQDSKLKDRGTRELIQEIDQIEKKLANEINFDKYVPKEDS